MTARRNDRMHRLLGYSALAGGLILPARGNAQIIYTDVDPDAVIFNDDMQFDMDGNGTADFKLVFESEFFATFAPPQLKLRINPLGSNQVAFDTQIVPITYSGTPWYTYVGGATQVLFTNVPALPADAWVSDALNFQLDIAALYERLFFFIYSESNYQAIVGGEFTAAEDLFAGVKLFRDGNYHYGWMRLQVDPETGITVRDYAWELTPETPLQTAVNAYSIGWTSVSDAGITETPEDLAFAFTGAGTEADISEYRVICVKTGAVDAITPEIATTFPAEKYISIIPDGSAEYSGNFDLASLDSDGDPIVAGTSYRLLVLNVMTPTSGYANILSDRSDAVTLVDTVSAATEVSLTDIGDAGNGADVKVKFDAPAITDGIAEYRIIIAQRDSADAITLETALALTPDRYISVAPGDIDYNIDLTAGQLDYNGDVIRPEKYKGIVLSVADGTTALHHAISALSGSVTLEMPTPVATVVTLADIAETATGADLRVTFNIPEQEQTIEEYRLFFVDFAEAFDFNVSEAVASPYYTVIDPNGADVTITGTAATLESDGDIVTWGVPYYAYVLSVPTDFGMGDNLSAPSNQVILNYPDNVTLTPADLNGAHIIASGMMVQILCPAVEGAVFELWGMDGRLHHRQNLAAGTTTLELNVPAAPYMALLRSPQGSFSQKITLVR